MTVKEMWLINIWRRKFILNPTILPACFSDSLKFLCVLLIIENNFWMYCLHFFPTLLNPWTKASIHYFHCWLVCKKEKSTIDMKNKHKFVTHHHANVSIVCFWGGRGGGITRLARHQSPLYFIYFFSSSWSPDSTNLFQSHSLGYLFLFI